MDEVKVTLPYKEYQNLLALRGASAVNVNEYRSALNRLRDVVNSCDNHFMLEDRVRKIVKKAERLGMIDKL